MSEEPLSERISDYKLDSPNQIITTSTMDRRSSISLVSQDTESTLTLDKLMQLSISKNLHPISFVKLLKDFKHKLLTQSQEIDLLGLYKRVKEDDDEEIDNDEGLSQLQLRYVFEYLIKNGAAELPNDQFHDLTELFGKYMSQLTINEQMSILLYFNQPNTEFPFEKLANCSPFITQGVLKYIDSIIELKTSHFKFLFTVGKFLKNLYISHDNDDDETLKNQIIVFSNYLKQNNVMKIDEYLNLNLQLYIQVNEAQRDKKNKSRHHSSHNNVENMINIRNNFKILRLRKIMWINDNIIINFCKNDDFFLKSFKTLLSLNTNTTVFFELVISLFDCMKLSLKNENNFNILQNFLLFKIPNLIKLLNLNQVNINDVLGNICNTLDDMKILDTKLSLMKEKFLKVLVNNELIKSVQLNKLLNTTTIITVNHQYINKELEQMPMLIKRKFEDYNIEFVSIEELNIIDTLNKFENLENEKLLKKFSELIIELINKLIQINDINKLRRLLIIISINEKVLNYIILDNSPYEFIEPLIEYLNNNMNNSNTGSGGNSNKFDNSNNFNDLGQGNEYNDYDGSNGVNDSLMMDLGLNLDEIEQRDNDDDENLKNGNNPSIQDKYTNLSIILMIIKYVFDTFEVRFDKLNVKVNDSIYQILNNKEHHLIDYKFLVGLNDKESKLNKDIQEFTKILFELSDKGDDKDKDKNGSNKDEGNNGSNEDNFNFDNFSNFTNNLESGGISDELISKYSLNELNCIINIIFKQSFKLYKLQIIDLNNYKNFFEYFIQNFLIFNLISIIEIIIDELNLELRQGGNYELLVDLLVMIIDGEYNNESFYLFNMIKRLVQEKLFVTLSKVTNKSEKLIKLIEKLKFKKEKIKETNEENELVGLIKYINEDSSNGAVTATTTATTVTTTTATTTNEIISHSISLNTLLKGLLSEPNKSEKIQNLINELMAYCQSMSHHNLGNNTVSGSSNYLNYELSYQLMSMVLLMLMNFKCKSAVNKSKIVKLLKEKKQVAYDRVSNKRVKIEVVSGFPKEEEDDDDEEQEIKEEKDTEVKSEEESTEGVQVSYSSDEVLVNELLEESISNDAVNCILEKMVSNLTR